MISKVDADLLIEMRNFARDVFVRAASQARPDRPRDPATEKALSAISAYAETTALLAERYRTDPIPEAPVQEMKPRRTNGSAAARSAQQNGARRTSRPRPLNH